MKTNQIKFFILFFIAYCILSLSNSYGFSYKELHEFEIYRNGKKIGFNKLYFKKMDNKIIVNTKIETVVKFGFISIFKYFHNSEEIWDQNKFIQAITFTQKNNRQFKFSAKRQGSKIQIESSGKKFFVSGNSLITSYWHQHWLNKKELIDSQHGKKRFINVKKEGMESISTKFGNILAQRYKVTGRQDKVNGKKIDYDIWYDEKKRWVKIKFFIKNSIIEYFLVTEY